MKQELRCQGNRQQSHVSSIVDTNNEFPRNCFNWYLVQRKGHSNKRRNESLFLILKSKNLTLEMELIKATTFNNLDA